MLPLDVTEAGKCCLWLWSCFSAETSLYHGGEEWISVGTNHLCHNQSIPVLFKPVCVRPVQSGLSKKTC